MREYRAELRLAAAELAEIDDAARMMGQERAAWMRQALLSRARGERAEADVVAQMGEEIARLEARVRALEGGR